MSGLLIVVIVALGAAAATAVLIAVVVLVREKRMDAQKALSSAILAVVGTAAVAVGFSAVAPSSPSAPPAHVAETGVVDDLAEQALPDPSAPIDVQLPTLAFDDAE